MNQSNKKRLLTNIGSSIGVKGVSIVISFLATPAYIVYFNKSPLLGVWLTIVGMLTWIINFDLGIGNGLRNEIVNYLIKKDFKILRRYISSAYFMLILISIIFMFIGSISIYCAKWNNILNISNEYISDSTLKMVILITFLGVLFYFILKIITSILLAMEKVAVVNFLQLITNLSNLIYIMVIQENNPEIAIVKLSYFYVLSLNIPYIIISIIMYGTKLKECKPEFKYIDKKIAFNITGLGGKFFFIQIMLMLINSTNEFFISKFYDPAYVVEYQIYYKMFYLIVTLFSLVTNPIWSNVTVAYNTGDYKWIQELRNKLNTVSYVAIMGLVFLIFIFPFISKIWLGRNNIHYQYRFGIIFAIYSALMIMVLSETAIANGINLLRMQLIFFSLGGLLKVPMSYFFSKIGWGWESVVIINILILLPFVLAQKIDLKYYINKY